jgi:peptidoglycan lytic transglycosylase G
MRRAGIALLLLIVLAGAALYYSLAMPYSGYEREAFVVIPPRTGTRDIARMLENAGVIQSEWQFLIARAFDRGSVLQAGEYRFDHPMTAREVFRKIARGDVFYYELRIPEGSNIFDIAAALEKLGLMKQSVFLAAARDPHLIRDLAPLAPSLEGYLFPSTYRLVRSTTPQQIAREMTAQFRKVWKELGGGATDVNRLVTLASLVEKETAIPDERPAVASVYSNRLARGMKLDCDPTTIYAAMLEGRYRGAIYRSDLESTNPYNTYRNPGLPPGPIANPGVASLKAALQPASTNFLYFVAKPDGSGGHSFSETFDQHLDAVRTYRSGR